MRNRVQADFLSLKRTIFFKIHLGVPIIGIAISLSYLYATKYDSIGFTANLLKVMALIYPIVIAEICDIVYEQEVEAGGCFWMLSAVSRSKSLLSKLFFLSCAGVFSCLLTVLGFGLLLPLINRDNLPDFVYLFFSGIIIWGCAIFLYVFHSWLALKYGRNVGFAVAAFEFLISGLMLTGLGDTVWFFAPCSWGVRTLNLFNGMYYHKSATSFLPIPIIITLIFTATIGMILILFKWFQKWEGRKYLE